jgi:hypothetical protein
MKRSGICGKRTRFRAVLAGVVSQYREDSMDNPFREGGQAVMAPNRNADSS